MSENVLAITIWTDYANCAFRLMGGALALFVFANVTSLFRRDFNRLRLEGCASLNTFPRVFELVLFAHDIPRSETRIDGCRAVPKRCSVNLYP